MGEPKIFWDIFRKYILERETEALLQQYVITFSASLREAPWRVRARACAGGGRAKMSARNARPPRAILRAIWPRRRDEARMMQ
jgi:hypothetical protein